MLFTCSKANLQGYNMACYIYISLCIDLSESLQFCKLTQVSHKHLFK